MITEAGTSTGINHILYNYRARIYAPKLGRFLQTDPIGTLDDRNLYAYVRNDPINLTDPSGLLADAGKKLLKKPVPGFYKQTSDYFDPNLTFRNTTVGELGMDVLGAAGGIRAISGAATLPEALSTGRNATQGIDVYMGVRGGEAAYCGISCDVTRRAAEHGARFDALDVITTQPVTLGEARAIEQAIIGKIRDLKI